MSTVPSQGDPGGGPGPSDPGYRVPTPTTALPTAPSRSGTAVAPTSHRGTAAKARDSFRSSEFLMTVSFVVLVLLATYVDEDTLARTDGWRYASFAVVAYVISRGLAKLGRDWHRD